MNNKKNNYTLLGVIKQHILKKRALLFLPLCLALVGCNKAESDRGANKQVELLRPYHALAVNLEDEELFVAFNNFVNAKEEPTEVLINGVPCYSSDSNIEITDNCKLSYNETTNSVNAEFSAIAQGIIQGNNTVTVKNLIRGTQESVGFYYDSQKPTLFVEGIKLAEDPVSVIANLNLYEGDVSGELELVPGAMVDITLTIKDPSDIKSVQFKANSKSYPDFPSEKEAYENAGSNLEDKRQAMEDWGGLHKSYLADLKAKRFVIEGVVWPEPDSEGSKFTYKIVDVHGQKSEGVFTVSGSKLVKSQALQLNNTLFQHIAPIANLSLDTVVNAVEDLKGFLERDMFPLPWVVSPYNFKDAPGWPNTGSCGAKCDQARGTLINPNTGTNVLAAADAQVTAFCGALGWSNCSAYVHFDKIRVINPKVTVRGQSSSTFDLKLGIHTAELSAPITVYTLDGRSKFNTTLSLKDFEIYSNLTFFIPTEEDDANALINVKRTPIGLYLIPNLFGNKQVYFLNSSCTGPHCNIVTDFLEPVYNLRLNKQARAQADKMLLDIAKGLEVAFEKETQWPAKTHTTITAADLTTGGSADWLEKLFIDPQSLVSVVNKRAHILNKAPRNAHFSYDTKVSVQRLVNGEVNNPSLGLETKGNGSYGYVKNANFPSYYAGSQGSLIDFAYAISEDSVNQMLLSAYQRSNVAATTISPSDPNTILFGDIPGDICLKLTLNSPPKVDFHGYYTQKVSVDATFTDKIAENAAKEQAARWKQLCQDQYGVNATECDGIEHDYQPVPVFDTSKDSVPSSVKLRMNDVLLSAGHGECDNGEPITPSIQDIPVAITNRLTLGVKEGKPNIQPYTANDDTFVSVQAKYTEHSAIASQLATAIALHVNQGLEDLHLNTPEALTADPVKLERLPVFDRMHAAGLFAYMPSWQARYGIKLLSFHIEPSSGYLSMTGKVDVKTITNGNNGNSCTDEGYFRYFCVVK